MFLLLHHQRVQPIRSLIRSLLPYPAQIRSLIRSLLPDPVLATFRASERLPMGLELSCSPRSKTSINNQTVSLNISNRQSCSWTPCSGPIKNGLKVLPLRMFVGKRLNNRVASSNFSPAVFDPPPPSPFMLCFCGELRNRDFWCSISLHLGIRFSSNSTEFVQGVMIKRIRGPE